MKEEESEIPQCIEGEKPAEPKGMDLEAGSAPNPASCESLACENPFSVVENPEENREAGEKRERKEGGDEGEEGDEASKKLKVERSLEEEEEGRLENVEANKEGGEGSKEEETVEEEQKKPVSAILGPKVFSSSMEMFDYFFNFLRCWPPNLDINKYEHMVFLDLLKKGHAAPDKKIGEGIRSFQVRYHPTWKSRCFFLVRVDGSVDDFSFRKCVDQILPLPENMKFHSTSDGSNVFDGKKPGGHQRGGGGRGGGGGGGGGRRFGGGRGKRGGFRK